MTAEAIAAPTGVMNEERLTPPPARLARLLGDEGGWREAAVRAASGLCMSAAFGLALGARDGGADLLVHAIGIAAAPAGVLLFGVPSLYIVLALFDAPIDALGMARCAGRGLASLGMVLAGLAPLTALYVVSAENGLWGAVMGFLVLMMAGLVGLGCFHGSLRRLVAEAQPSVRASVMLAATVFGLLVTVGAARIWFGWVPLFGGGL